MSPQPQPVNEWSTDDPHGHLEIPAARLATQRWRFVTAHDIGLTGTCAMYEILEPAGVLLHDVLVDTSVRVQSILTKKRVTHRRKVLLVHATVILYPLDRDVE